MIILKSTHDKIVLELLEEFNPTFSKDRKIKRKLKYQIAKIL